jgi:hypothetical protein
LFAEIADREGKGERHIRRLIHLAFVSPKAVAAIIGGEASATLTISELVHSLPHSWQAQERLLGA